MKHKILLVVIALVCSKFSWSQVPNAALEKWTGTDPDEWVSTNILTFFSNPQSVYKSTDAHGGSFAAEINTIQVVNKPPGNMFPDYTGSIATGKLVNLRPVLGYSYNRRPDALNFWYKYMPTGADTAVGLVALTRWNSTAGKTDTVALGMAYTADSNSIYKMMTVSLNYLSSLDPDTAIILLTSSGRGASQAGSKFLVDDVSFVGGNTGIAKPIQTQISIFPNPASNYIDIYVPQLKGNSVLSFYDLQGRLVKSSAQTVADYQHIYTGDLAKGTYLIQLKSDDQIATSKLVIQ